MVESLEGLGKVVAAVVVDDVVVADVGANVDVEPRDFAVCG